MKFLEKDIIMKKFMKQGKTKTATIFLFTIFLCANVWAQQKPTPEDGKEVLTNLEQRMQKNISVTFKDVPIEDVISIIAQQAEVDIIKSPKVIGNVTATLTDVPLEEALNNILSVHGCTYILDENMIRVVSAEDISEKVELLVSKVYRITYADVKELEKALTKFISQRGSISAMPGTSNLIITDTESKIDAISKFIEEVDRVTQQVLIEVRIYDVTDTDDFNLDIKWRAQRQVQTGDNLLFGPDTGGTLSSPPTPMDVDGTPVTLVHPLKRADPFATGSFDKTNGGALRLGFLNDSLSLDVLLTALQKTEYATLLANPSIMVLDNETAQFEIVKEIPYKEENSTSGGGQLTSTRFKNVGVILKVMPHITRDDMLRVRIMPEFGVAEAQRYNSETGEPIVPTVNTRKLDTIALLKSEETIVLGGLRKQEVAKNLYKTPILGDLPLLGGLFRSENETSDTTELLVFITPKIIDIPVLNSSEAEIYEHTNIRQANYPPLRDNK